MKPHTVRKACEVSANVAFGWPNSEICPFKLANNKDYSCEEASLSSIDEPYITV